MDAAVVAEDLGRVFRTRGETVVALDGVSFSISPGEIVGMLGPNGAGKTTLTKIIATLLLPSTGRVRVFGNDVVVHRRRARESTGVVFGGDRGLYGRLSGRDNLRFFAAVGGTAMRAISRKADAALADVGLGEVADRAVETYSRGMRQRLHLAIGLITNPRLLLLDEPTAGLDPVEAERIRGVIEHLRSYGAAVMLTSHYLLDIERLADRVLVLSRGKLVTDTTVGDLVRASGYVASVTVRGNGSVPRGIAEPSADLTVDEVVTDGLSWCARLRLRDWGTSSLLRLSTLIGEANVLAMDVAPVRLEDVYTLTAGGGLTASASAQAASEQ